MKETINISYTLFNKCLFNESLSLNFRYISCFFFPISISFNFRPLQQQQRKEIRFSYRYIERTPRNRTNVRKMSDFSDITKTERMFFQKSETERMFGHSEIKIFIFFQYIDILIYLYCFLSTIKGNERND